VTDDHLASRPSLTAGDPLAPAQDHPRASSPAHPAFVAPAAPPLRSQLGLALALCAFPALLIVGPLNLLLSVPALLLCLSGLWTGGRHAVSVVGAVVAAFATLIGLGLLALVVLFVKVLGEASAQMARG
jgi:hypothetical protein